MRLTNWHFICSVWLATWNSNAVHGPYNMNVICFRKDDLWEKNFRLELQERFVFAECSNNNLVCFIVHIITFMCSIIASPSTDKRIVFKIVIFPQEKDEIVCQTTWVCSCKMFFISVSFGYFDWVKFRIFNPNYHE